MKRVGRCLRTDLRARAYPVPSRRLTRGIPLDHLTLIPASQLPFKEHWNQIAKSLPSGEVLMVVPIDNTPMRQTLRSLVPQLRARGRHITAMSSKQLPC